MQKDLFDRFLTRIFGEKSPESKKKPSHPSGKTRDGQNNGDLAKTISLNGRTIAYTLRRSSRRSIGFLVNETGLRVTAPKRNSLYSIENAIMDKQKWILSKLDFYRFNHSSETVPIEWTNGSLLPFLGDKLSLQINNGTTGKTFFNIENGKLLIYHPDSGKPFDSPLKNWLVQQAGAILAKRLELQAERMNIPFGAFSLSNARTRWGSCTARRHIRLNWRLVHCDISLIDYVVIHELAHCLEMNHSQRFWNIVATYYPDYKHARKQLHLQSPTLFSLFDKRENQAD